LHKPRLLVNETAKVRFQTDNSEKGQDGVLKDS